jgi:hypothetical protein
VIPDGCPPAVLGRARTSQPAGAIPGSGATGAVHRGRDRLESGRHVGYLKSLYHRHVTHNGGYRFPAAKNKAIITVAYAMLVVIWNMLSTGWQYEDRGTACFERTDPGRQACRLVARVEALGKHVTRQRRRRRHGQPAAGNGPQPRVKLYGEHDRPARRLIWPNWGSQPVANHLFFGAAHAGVAIKEKLLTWKL